MVLALAALLMMVKGLVVSGRAVEMSVPAFRVVAVVSVVVVVALMVVGLGGRGGWCLWRAIIVVVGAV